MKKSKQAFTLIELLVVIAVIAVLMGILMPALSHAREQGKRAVCMNHLKQMMLAWTMYADENREMIVCGDAGEYSGPGEGEKKNPYWVQKDWVHINSNDIMTIEQKEEAIRRGALFPYCENPKSYHCPTGNIARAELRMFSIVDSMNGRPTGVKDVQGVPVIRKRTKIKDASNRIVFMDDGGSGGYTQGAWSIRTSGWQWWDPVPVRHSKGTTLAFADGRATHRPWKDPQTISMGNLTHDQIMRNQGGWKNAGTGNEDYSFLRYGVWGVRDKQ